MSKNKKRKRHKEFPIPCKVKIVHDHLNTHGMWISRTGTVIRRLPDVIGDHLGYAVAVPVHTGVDSEEMNLFFLANELELLDDAET